MPYARRLRIRQSVLMVFFEVHFWRADFFSSLLEVLRRRQDKLGLLRMTDILREAFA